MRTTIWCYTDGCDNKVTITAGRAGEDPQLPGIMAELGWKPATEEHWFCDVCAESKVGTLGPPPMPQPVRPPPVRCEEHAVGKGRCLERHGHDGDHVYPEDLAPAPRLRDLRNPALVGPEDIEAELDRHVEAEKAARTQAGIESDLFRAFLADERRKAEEELSVGAKYDHGKTRLDLISPTFLFGLGRVLTFGANKYADRNWEKGIKFGRVFGALMRHLWAWWGGENTDPETGESHLYHAACCVMFLAHFADSPDYEDFDDRPNIVVPWPEDDEITMEELYDADYEPDPDNAHAEGAFV